jgi:hypothetical protein
VYFDAARVLTDSAPPSRDRGRVFRGGWEGMADYDALFWAK